VGSQERLSTPREGRPAARRNRRAFPLLPRPRATGIAYGTLPSRRRGQGAEIAGSRRYVPGDRLAWIDWYASARESMIRDDDIFIVRQYYAEMAPRVILVVDRRPSLGLYPPDLPWLSKPDVIHEATTAIIAAAHAARAYLGYLDFALRGADGEATPHWIPPRRQSARAILTRIRDDFRAPPPCLELAIDYLLGLPSDVPPGTFVFVLSDYLQPIPDTTWSRARAQRWDLVPVIIQDPVWEQSFPDIGGLVLPLSDPATGKRAALRLTKREARARRDANTQRLAGLVDRFRRLSFDPVVLDTTDPRSIDAAFLEWAARRRLAPRRAR
jgi:uncharacterized protein (DUF58 family)